MRSRVHHRTAAGVVHALDGVTVDVPAAPASPSSARAAAASRPCSGCSVASPCRRRARCGSAGRRHLGARRAAPRDVPPARTSATSTRPTTCCRSSPSPRTSPSSWRSTPATTPMPSSAGRLLGAPRAGRPGPPVPGPALGRAAPARGGRPGGRPPARVILADEPTGALDAGTRPRSSTCCSTCSRSSAPRSVMVDPRPSGGRAGWTRTVELRDGATRGRGARCWLGTSGGTWSATPGARSRALAGIVLGVGLFSAVLFFIDGSSASMTARAVAPLPHRHAAGALRPARQAGAADRADHARSAAGRRDRHVQLELSNRSARPANEVVIRDEPPSRCSTSTNRPAATVTRGSRSRRATVPLAQGEAKLGLTWAPCRPGRRSGRVRRRARTRRRTSVGLGLWRDLLQPRDRHPGPRQRVRAAEPAEP